MIYGMEVILGILFLLFLYLIYFVLKEQKTRLGIKYFGEIGKR